MGMKMKTLHKRRKRRQQKAKSRPMHRAKSGRTGSIKEKQTPSSKHFEYHRCYVFIFPNWIQKE